jgi:hypothetical protein
VRYWTETRPVPYLGHMFLFEHAGGMPGPANALSG